MAKGTQKAITNQTVNAAQGQSQDYTNNYLTGTGAERTQARSNANDMYGQMYGGYTDLANNKGITPDLLSSLGGGVRSGAVNPNFNTGMFGDVQAAYRNFMGGGGVNLANNNYAMDQLKGLSSTGGWDPSRIASMDQNIAGLKQMGNATGGLDADAMARMRGSGVFDEFAKTGGMDAAAQAAYRQRGTAGIPAQYQTAMDQANRMSGITGNYNPAAIAQMARNSAYDTNKASIDTEAGLNQQLMQGREWGGSNIASSEAGLQGLISQNKLAGLQGASSVEANMLNSIAQNRTGAATGLGNLDIGGQQLIQQGKEFGTSGLESLAARQLAAQQAAAAAGASASGQNAANAKWLAEFGVQNQEAGLAGLGNLYTSSPAEVAYYDKARQGTINDNMGNTDAAAGVRMQNNPQRDWASTITGLIGSGVGAATGLAGLGGGGGNSPYLNKAPYTTSGGNLPSRRAF